MVCNSFKELGSPLFSIKIVFVPVFSVIPMPVLASIVIALLPDVLLLIVAVVPVPAPTDN